MLLLAFVPPPADPSFAAGAYGAILGDGWTVVGFRSQEEVPDDVAAAADFVVAAAGQAVGAHLIRRAPRLRLIQVPGHGFDHIDLEAARAAGLPVATIASSGAEAHTVAEMTILLAGVASRRILDGDRLVRQGAWGQQGMLQQGVFELAGKTLGLVGFGRIAREVATRGCAFAMRVLYHDRRRRDPATEADLGVGFRTLDALLGESDVVSLHLPLTPATRGLIGRRELSLMKPTAVLVNTARGQLVDTAALAAALAEGRLHGAAFDVFDPEPPAPDDPLRAAPNVLLSPHMAGVTLESILRALTAALENCRRVARGEPPRDVIDDEPAWT
jgi:D-3-phosphoglycerate dehydrogenase